MSQTPAGARKVAAVRLGIDEWEYQLRIASGEKWCTKCKAWHPRKAFAKDNSRGDGLKVACVKSTSTGRPRGWHGRPSNNPMTGRPGPAPHPPRDNDKIQARMRINVEVRMGRRARPDSLPCTDCGHKGEDRQHEYDHYLGYAAAHHYDVQPVCAPCHHKRERERKNGKH